MLCFNPFPIVFRVLTFTSRLKASTGTRILAVDQSGAPRKERGFAWNNCLGATQVADRANVPYDFSMGKVQIRLAPNVQTMTITVVIP